MSGAPASRALGERHHYLNAHRVLNRLWVGAWPQHVRRLDFTLWVQCASEFGAPGWEFGGTTLRGLRMRYCPLHDDGRPFMERHWDRAVKAANEIEAHWREGGRVLVTCAEGRNRSAFVAALVVQSLTGYTSAMAIDHLRRTRAIRGGVLMNKAFCNALARTDGWARLPARERETGIPPWVEQRHEKFV